MQPEWKKERLKVWMEAYGDAVLRTCYLYLKDRYLAEDAAQETFVKVYEHMETFRGGPRRKHGLPGLRQMYVKTISGRTGFKRTDFPGGGRTSGWQLRDG